MLAPFYAHNHWIDLEVTVLDMHALCLKKLNRMEEFIQTTLKMLSRLVQSRRSNRKVAQYDTGQLGGQKTVIPASLNALALASSTLSQPIVVPLGNFFQNIKVGPFIQHNLDEDGFRLPLGFQYCLADSLVVQEVRTRLLSTRDKETQEIWVSAEGPLTIKSGRCEVWMTSNVRKLTQHFKVPY